MGIASRIVRIWGGTKGPAAAAPVVCVRRGDGVASESDRSRDKRVDKGELDRCRLPPWKVTGSRVAVAK